MRYDKYADEYPLDIFISMRKYHSGVSNAFNPILIKFLWNFIIKLFYTLAVL